VDLRHAVGETVTAERPGITTGRDSPWCSASSHDATAAKLDGPGCLHRDEQSLRYLMRVVPLGAPVFVAR